MPEEKPRRGRPPHQPTVESRALVVRMVGSGALVSDIARAVGVAESTLRGHYAAELATPRPQAALPGIAPPDPQPPRPRSGRPEHVPTDETREKVEILVAGRMPAWQIAQALGVSEPTLRQHYEAELDGGRARRTAEMMAALYRQGLGGNTSAAKAWLQMHSQLEDPPPPEPDEPEVRRGKKEAALEAALNAGKDVDWAKGLPH